MLALDPEALIYSKHGIFIIFRRKLHEFFGCFFFFFLVFTIDVFFDEISQLDQKKKKKSPQCHHILRKKT
jgi:hypothetical protein